MASSIPFAAQILIIAVLVLLSALFSGLTLGLMGLDKNGLEIVIGGDDPVAAENARKIYPVREDGNLLLCTLLLGNVAVNALLSIIMADLTDGLLGFLVSTGVIVIFGEITPQALCSRHALTIGSKAVPIVKLIMLVSYPIAKPMAMALDKLLGRELGTIYSKYEMKKLIEIHMERGGFDKDTGTAMTGALKYHDITVEEIMTPIAHVFMLPVDEKLSFKTIATIFRSGFSRIPVYEVSKDNVIGLLFVKDLIFVDPDDETPVRNFVQIFGRGVHVVWPDDKLGDVLRELKLGRSHMALVRDVNNEDSDQDPYYELKGIITLEDIIEVILGDEIVDETDVFLHAEDSVKIDRTTFDWARLRLLDSKIVDETLSPEEVKAVCAHLRTNHEDAVSSLTNVQLKTLVATTKVSELEKAEQNLDEELPSDLLYKKGEATYVCTLILSGKVTIFAGQDKFRSDVGAWTLLGSQALTDPDYMPDFTAYVAESPCRCLQIPRDSFNAALNIGSGNGRYMLSNDSIGTELNDAVTAKVTSDNGDSSNYGFNSARRKAAKRDLSAFAHTDANDLTDESLTKPHSRGSMILAEIEKIESISGIQICKETDIEEGVISIINSTLEGIQEMDQLQRDLTNDGELQPRKKKSTRSMKPTASPANIQNEKNSKTQVSFIGSDSVMDASESNSKQ